MTTPRAIFNDELLAMAEKHPPPQSWYDDTTDPFKPEPVEGSVRIDDGEWLPLEGWVRVA